jgi:hypothetical protein
VCFTPDLDVPRRHAALSLITRKPSHHTSFPFDQGCRLPGRVAGFEKRMCALNYFLIAPSPPVLHVRVSFVVNASPSRPTSSCLRWRWRSCRLRTERAPRSPQRTCPCRRWPGRKGKYQRKRDGRWETGLARLDAGSVSGRHGGRVGSRVVGSAGVLVVGSWHLAG